MSLISKNSIVSPSSELPLVAIVAGPTATILNRDPLVTSNKARQQHGLPLVRDWFGRIAVTDSLHFQRLAAPTTVYVEVGSAHPMENPAALNSPPDGYLDEQNNFSVEARSPLSRPVHVVTLLPEDGLYPLPYMARRADGTAWERDSTGTDRQTFYPDASRLVEEIERTTAHLNGNISGRTRLKYWRVAPSAGASPEKAGVDYFPYGYDEYFPSRETLASITNAIQDGLTGEPALRGIVWLEGSPRITETLYWFQLLIDTDRPIAGAAAQRPNHRPGADGGQQLIDAIDYILSNAWEDDEGRNRVGAVLINDQRIFASREAAKTAGRPGGFTDVGGHGGVLGSTVGPRLTFVPARHHGSRSALRLSTLPDEVSGVTGPVRIKTNEGKLRAEAIPCVEIIALPGWMTRTDDQSNCIVRQIDDAIARLLADAPLAGIIAEGVTGGHFEKCEAAALELAVFSGLPVVKVGRDAPGSITVAGGHCLIGGSNLTAAKARVLLMACLLRFGGLPRALDPHVPTDSERAATKARLAEFQNIFETH